MQSHPTNPLPPPLQDDFIPVSSKNKNPKTPIPPSVATSNITPNSFQPLLNPLVNEISTEEMDQSLLNQPMANDTLTKGAGKNKKKQDQHTLGKSGKEYRDQYMESIEIDSNADNEPIDMELEGLYLKVLEEACRKGDSNL